MSELPKCDLCHLKPALIKFSDCPGWCLNCALKLSQKLSAALCVYLTNAREEKETP